MAPPALSIYSDKVAEGIAEDETGSAMGEFLASLLIEFGGDENAFRQWLQAACNDAMNRLDDGWEFDTIAQLEWLIISKTT
ncbi:MAG: hypothetical protein AAGH68_02240 [Pseudomonadota bacterium]